MAEFITGMNNSHITLDVVVDIFKCYSDHVVYFNNGEPDDYRYCLTFHGEHAHYHRFTKKDYEASDL